MSATKLGAIITTWRPKHVSEEEYISEHERAGIELARDWTAASHDAMWSEITRLRTKTGVWGRWGPPGSGTCPA